jgi:hypothetical protein
MSIKTEGYSRKPFHVDAVQVTAENMAEVAAWCTGEIRTGKRIVRDEKNKILERKEVSFIKVSILRPLNERQTKAHIGDWILLSEAGFKVYTENAFSKAFEKEDVVLDFKGTLGQLDLGIPEITLTLEGARA